jgi:hypothetical protein
MSGFERQDDGAVGTGLNLLISVNAGMYLPRHDFKSGQI